MGAGRVGVRGRRAAAAGAVSTRLGCARGRHRHASHALHAHANQPGRQAGSRHATHLHVAGLFKPAIGRGHHPLLSAADRQDARLLVAGWEGGVGACWGRGGARVWAGPGARPPGRLMDACTPPAPTRAWGGLTMAANWLMPNMPRLEMVKVPPVNSAGCSLPSLACERGGGMGRSGVGARRGAGGERASRAGGAGAGGREAGGAPPCLTRPASSLTSAAMAARPFLSASRTIGTISPMGVCDKGGLAVACRRLQGRRTPLTPPPRSRTCLHSHRAVHARVLADVLAVPGGVNLWDLLERERGGLRVCVGGGRGVACG